ncbi:hypothetical protein C7967_106216 [Thalassospira sp. 11-3]|nr:hypothetical protein C7967_106216 [Thalassospira sp. 11-3]
MSSADKGVDEGPGIDWQSGSEMCREVGFYAVVHPARDRVGRGNSRQSAGLAEK